MKESKTCINCTLPIRGLEAEGDRPICLTCLQSLTPHCSFDGGYYSPDAVIKMGVIRQTLAQNENLTDQPKDKPCQ
jgi:hypothetical protein